jgi:FkbH-like protein
MTPLRVALLSSCTIEVLERPLAAALRERGFEPSFWISGFGQYRQDVLDPASGLYQQDPNVVLLYLDAEDLFREQLQNPFATLGEARRDAGRRAAADVASLVDTITSRLPKATVVVNTSAVAPLNALTGLEYNSEYGIQDAVAEYNAAIGALAGRGGAVVLDAAALAANVGFSRWRDARMWYLARLRLSRAALEALAAGYGSIISARLGKIKKCVAVDLDNTLWGGIIGEDGFDGIKLGEEGIGLAFAEFQEELLNLYRKGILLAICSKNNPDDALQVIRHHPGMRLREEHFAAVRINWDDKASNLRAMAEELNIGLDAFVFIDDNPVERSWIMQSAPEVIVPEWPADPVDYKAALLQLGARYFPKLGITSEDRKRGELYQAQAARRKLETSGTSLEEFYRALDMRVRVGRADSFTIPRIAQLTQKTNQFNLTTRRYTEAEIRAASEDDRTEVFWLDLDDRFGPSGVVGVLILKEAAAGEWNIDTFLLSCRVMGRTVENAFLAAAAREVGATRLVGEYAPTAKNAPVKDLYARLGFAHVRDVGDTRVWRLDSADRLEVPPWFQVDRVVPATSAAAADNPSLITR